MLATRKLSGTYITYVNKNIVQHPPCLTNKNTVRRPRYSGQSAPGEYQ